MVETKTFQALVHETKTLPYSGIAISYNIAFAIFGGCTPFISALLILIHLSHSALAPAFLVMFTAVISLVCFYVMPETTGRKL